MNKLLSLVLKNVSSLAVNVLFLSANTTSGWVAHQPGVPEEIKRFKKHN